MSNQCFVVRFGLKKAGWTFLRHGPQLQQLVHPSPQDPLQPGHFHSPQSLALSTSSPCRLRRHIWLHGTALVSNAGCVAEALLSGCCIAHSGVPKGAWQSAVATLWIRAGDMLIQSLLATPTGTYSANGLVVCGHVCRPLQCGLNVLF